MTDGLGEMVVGGIVGGVAAGTAAAKWLPWWTVPFAVVGGGWVCGMAAGIWGFTRGGRG